MSPGWYQERCNQKLYAPVNAAQGLKIATGRNALKSSDISMQTRTSWYHPIGQKHAFLHVKFEIELSISFSRKSMTKIKPHFFKGEGPSFFLNTFHTPPKDFFSTSQAPGRMLGNTMKRQRMQKVGFIHSYTWLFCTKKSS